MPIKKYLPEFIYGGVDGLVTTFAIVTGIVGASLSLNTILIIGIASLFADGFSMGASSYLSSNARKDMYENSDKSPISSAIVTFFSFILIGFIPLVSYLLIWIAPSITINPILFSTLVTLIAFFVIGFVKGTLLKNRPILEGILILSIGSIAALVAFGIGYFLSGLNQVL